jgi:hypothetical protein
MPLAVKTPRRAVMRTMRLASAALLGTLGLTASATDAKERGRKVNAVKKKGKPGPPELQGPQGAQGPAGTLAGVTTRIATGTSARLGVAVGSSVTAVAECADPTAVVTGISYFFIGDTFTANVLNIGFVLEIGGPAASAFVVAERVGNDGGVVTVTVVAGCLSLG